MKGNPMTSVNKSSHRAVRGSVALLMCGVLLQAPLLGADGRVYAVAQGPVLAVAV